MAVGTYPACRATRLYLPGEGRVSSCFPEIRHEEGPGFPPCFPPQWIPMVSGSLPGEQRQRSWRRAPHRACFALANRKTKQGMTRKRWHVVYSRGHVVYSRGDYGSPLTRTLSLFCPVPAQEGLTAGPTRLQPSPGAEEKAGKEQKAPEGSAAAVTALNRMKRHEKGSTPKKLQLPACPAAGGWLCACAAAGSFQAAGAVPAG